MNIPGDNQTSVSESLKAQLISMGLGAKYMPSITAFLGMQDTPSNEIMLYGALSAAVVHTYLWFQRLPGVSGPKSPAP